MNRRLFNETRYLVKRLQERIAKGTGAAGMTDEKTSHTKTSRKILAGTLPVVEIFEQDGKLFYRLLGFFTSLFSSKKREIIERAQEILQRVLYERGIEKK